MALPASLKPLARPSGALAMLAIDQRESMRAMFQEFQSSPVTDAQLIDFKLAALRSLTPYASAVLIDQAFAWRRAIDERSVAPTCSLISSVDRFIPSDDEIVADVEIDETVDCAQVRRDGGAALKMLITWRPDESVEKRRVLITDFIQLCRSARLISVLEPVSRKPRDGRPWNLNDGIAAAAAELGNMGVDLYKSEVPRHGNGGEKAVRDECARLTKLIRSPWVVLSSGVPPDEFPQAVEWACLEGASGFLAGRAVWRECIGSADIPKSLDDDAVPRLRRLCDVVDRIVGH